MKKLFIIMFIWAISTTVNAQYSINGQWQNPSCYGVNDGELHIEVIGTNGLITFFYDGAISGLCTNQTGYFYNLAPDTYSWGFIYLNQIHYYPPVTLNYPVFLQSQLADINILTDRPVKVVKDISNTFGANIPTKP